MEKTIQFLEEKLAEEIRTKAMYVTKSYLSPWDEVSLQETLKAIDHYTEAIATIKVFNNLKVA